MTQEPPLTKHTLLRTDRAVCVVCLSPLAFLMLFACCNRSEPEPGTFSVTHQDVKRSRAFAFTDEESGVAVDVDAVSTEVTFTEADGVTSWTAPPNTHTDWASVPDSLLSLVGRPDNAKIARAALVHDAYCQEFRRSDDRIVRSEKYRTEPWRETHRMFYDACRASGASDDEAGRWWLAVHVWGPRWDANGKTIENGLWSIAQEVTLALLFGPDGQERDSTPPMEELESKLEGYEEAANAILEVRRKSVSLAREDKLAACRAALDGAVANLARRAEADRGSEVVYQALTGELTADVADELMNKRPRVALDLYDRATRTFRGLQQRPRLEGSATERIVRVHCAEALAHKKVGDHRSATLKLESAESGLERLKAIHPRRPIPRKLDSRYRDARERVR